MLLKARSASDSGKKLSRLRNLVVHLCSSVVSKLCPLLSAPPFSAQLDFVRLKTQNCFPQLKGTHTRTCQTLLIRGRDFKGGAVQRGTTLAELLERHVSMKAWRFYGLNDLRLDDIS